MLFCVAGVALCDIPQCFMTCQKWFVWQAQYFCHVFRGCVAISVASATLWRPSMSFCVAGAALETCRVAWLLRLAMSGLRDVVTLTTPHSTFFTPHFTFHTFHSAISIPHFNSTLSTLYTPHFQLYTQHSTLSILHSSPPHFTLHTLHSTLDTPHLTLCTHTSAPHSSPPRFTLHTPRLTPHT